jgi:uncharacterized protein (DUF1330 family)
LFYRNEITLRPIQFIPSRTGKEPHDNAHDLRQHRKPMAEKLIVVASLFVHPGHEAEFERFESAAASIMQRHGGRIERRIGFASNANPEQPHEVHILEFPDEASFARYRADADLQALADLRTRAIRHTVAWTGKELASFPIE